jgi:hypothetical protein
LRHSEACFERFLHSFALGANGGHDGTLDAAQYVRLHPQGLDTLDGVLDLGFRGILSHDDNHGCDLSGVDANTRRTSSPAKRSMISAIAAMTQPAIGETA